jgi:small subunit ribosomal protein S20
VANSAQARKRARQIEQRTLHNASQKSALRTAVKKVLKSVQSDVNAAKAELKDTFKLIDRVAGRKVIHPNKAARLKSRLTKKIKQAS